MKRFGGLVLVIILGFTLTFGACSEKDSSGEVLEKIGDTEITRGHVLALANMLATLNGYSASELTEEQKESLIESSLQYNQEIAVILTEVDKKKVVTKEVLADVDQKVKQVYASTGAGDVSNGGISVTPEEAKEKLEDEGVDEEILKWFFESQAIVEAFAKKIEEENPVTDEDAQAYFSSHSDEYALEQSAHLYHILVGDKDHKAEDREKALGILDEIRGGRDFAELAKEHSKDDGTAPAGGDLGESKKDGSYVAPFEEAAFHLQEGEISEIVETEFGFHIIKATDVQSGQEQTFEEAKEKVLDDLKTKSYETKVSELKKKLKVKDIDEDLKIELAAEM